MLDQTLFLGRTNPQNQRPALSASAAAKKFGSKRMSGPLRFIGTFKSVDFVTSITPVFANQVVTFEQLGSRWFQDGSHWAAIR